MSSGAACQLACRWRVFCLGVGSLFIRLILVRTRIKTKRFVFRCVAAVTPVVVQRAGGSRTCVIAMDSCSRGGTATGCLAPALGRFLHSPLFALMQTVCRALSSRNEPLMAPSAKYHGCCRRQPVRAVWSAVQKIRRDSTPPFRCQTLNLSVK